MVKNDKLIQIHERDNVAVALVPLAKGEAVELGGRQVTVKEAVDPGHKIAICEIPAYENIIKYG